MRPINLTTFITYLLCWCICILPGLSLAQEQGFRDSLLTQARMHYAAGHYQSTLDVLLSIPGIEDTTVFNPDQKRALLRLSQAYAALGDNRMAYLSFERYRMIKDSLLASGKAHALSQLEAKYQTEKKDRKIAEQQLLLRENEAKAFRTSLVIWVEVIGGMLTLLLFLISLGNLRKKQKINRKVREQLQHSREIEQLQAHIKGTEDERRKIAIQLQQGVYPVVSRATGILNNLKESDTSLNNSESFSETCQILNQVKKSLDDICLRHEAEEADTGQLVSVLKRFLDNVPARNNLRIAFSWSGPESLLPAAQVLSLKRIVQELLQNIIKHSGATQATLHLTYTPGGLILSVADNGKGFDAPLTAERGMGLTNVRKRVEKMSGSLNIAQVQGTQVSIVVPIQDIPDTEAVTMSAATQAIERG